jgi:V8-like Glu-specific endopeptidase
LEISLCDNHLLAFNDRVLHYTTPCGPGSSGSPVFEEEDWRVVAIHHKGTSSMKRLDGQGTYEVNEGIAILAVLKAMRESLY